MTLGHFIIAWLWAALVVIVFVTVAFGVALRLKRNSVADVAWGLGFIVSALTIVAVSGGLQATRQSWALVLVAAWGTRLAVHIYRRNKGKGEDYRYAEMAERGGHGRFQTYRKVFLSQGLLLLVVGLPVSFIEAATVQRGMGWLDYVGIVVWVVGFAFETAADAQLSRFIASPANKGQIMMRGVWHYSRHPNYFGEVTQWWGLGLMALSVPYGWIGLVGPVTITVLIVFVSGVPLLEKHYDGNKAYAAYRERTSILIPWPPRQKPL